MKNSVKIKCPAKINLTLEIVNRRNDGFHNIKSIMQTINLYDYITIKLGKSSESIISLSGTNKDIPYNENNLVYKATELFLKEANINDLSIDIHIEKNIPISAGLAGGSTDAAGTIFGLNHLLNTFNKEYLNVLCSKLGSDLNVCLNGGTILATSRGEITEKLKDIESKLTLIKPKKLGISAGEAYSKYAKKEIKPQNNMTEKMIKAIDSNEKIEPFLYNDLEYAIFNDYTELQKLKHFYPKAIMSGSGSTYFVLDKIEKSFLPDEYLYIEGLKFISAGVSISD